MNATPKKVKAWPLVLLAGVGLGWVLHTWQHDRRPSKTHTPHTAPSQASATADSHGETLPGAQRQPLYWYDPMVPNQHFDKPGKSPFMDMALVPKYADESSDASTSATNVPGIQVDGRVAQSLGIRLAKVERRDMASQGWATGTVMLNGRDVAIVQARAAGFVERVYAHAPGDVVASGAPLADILVPEWAGAQAEYLAIKRTGDTALTQAARQRLLLLGMPATTVDRIERAGQPQATYTVTAPSAGVIQELMVRNGMTVSAGMTLARLNGLDTVWVEATLPEAQAASAQPGQMVEVSTPAYPSDLFKGRVQAVLPEGQADTRTLRLRIELPNKDARLKAGMSAQVALTGSAHLALAAPTESLIRTGRRTLVYVTEANAQGPTQGKGRYSAVEVQTGGERDGYTEIRHGLTEGQQVVASGPFLIDSEASMQGVALAAPSSSTGAGNAVQAAAPASAAAPTYEGHGRITDLSADTVELQHDAIPALKWSAMTMPFAMVTGAMPKSAKVGDEVRFRFTMGGDGPLIQSVQLMAPRKGGRP